MTSGKGEGLPPILKKWLENLLPEYLSKTQYGKISVPGCPPPTDDSDLHDWVLAKREQWEKLYSEELMSIADTPGGSSLKIQRERFSTFFRNAKHKAKKDQIEKLANTAMPETAIRISSVSNSSASPTPYKPFLFQTPMMRTARQLFLETIRASVSEEISLLREQKRLDYKHHLGLLTSELTRRWDGLNSNEKLLWEEKAKTSYNGDINQIYRNQTHFQNEMTTVLSDLSGPLPSQLGKSSFYLLFGYRDIKENVITGAISVRPHDDGVGFEHFLDNKLKENVTTSWRAYCSKYIPENQEKHIKFATGIGGRPVFPNINEEIISLQELRRILTFYLEALWDFVRADNDPLLIAWREMPSRLFFADFPENLKLDSPETMPTADVFSLVTYLKNSRIIPPTGISKPPADGAPEPRSCTATIYPVVEQAALDPDIDTNGPIVLTPSQTVKASTLTSSPANSSPTKSAKAIMSPAINTDAASLSSMPSMTIEVSDFTIIDASSSPPSNVLTSSGNSPTTKSQNAITSTTHAAPLSFCSEDNTLPLMDSELIVSKSASPTSSAKPPSAKSPLNSITPLSKNTDTIPLSMASMPAIVEVSEYPCPDNTSAGPPSIIAVSDAASSSPLSISEMNSSNSPLAPTTQSHCPDVITTDPVEPLPLFSEDNINELTASSLRVKRPSDSPCELENPKKKRKTNKHSTNSDVPKPIRRSLRAAGSSGHDNQTPAMVSSIDTDDNSELVSARTGKQLKNHKHWVYAPIE